MEPGIMSIGIPGMVIAPLPMRSYVGLGLGSRNVVNMHR